MAHRLLLQLLMLLGVVAASAACPADGVVAEGEGEGEGEGEDVVVCDVATVVASPLLPVVGELFLAHIGLGGFALGEATLGQLPDGTRFLIDVGNDSHSDDVIDAIDAFFGERVVDVVVLTHHHADHEDGLSDLLADVAVGTVVHRGFTDVTDAANDATVGALCDLRPDVEQLELCVTASGACDATSSQAPATSCPGLGASFGGGALRIVAANATTATGQRYETLVGPLLTDDSNGENARSVVAVLAHGAFRAVAAGDLTGGGSDTDPVEAFLVTQLGATLPAADVLHLSHHARDTSSSAAWLAAMLPADGRPRTAVAGISTAHLGSPHDSVVQAVTDRLQGGRLFVTRVATGGSDTDVVNADGGTVRVLSADGWAAYIVQAVDADGNVRGTVQVTSAAACTP